MTGSGIGSIPRSAPSVASVAGGLVLALAAALLLFAVCSPAYRADRVAAQRAWESTRKFFTDNGIAVSSIGPPIVRVRRPMLSRYRGPHGCVCGYRRPRKDILISTFGDLRRCCPTWLGVPFSRELQESFLVHESAHYMADCLVGDLALGPHEYVAYAAQFTSLSGPTRAAILSLYEGGCFTSYLSVSASNLAIMGPRFGVAAYELHSWCPELLHAFLGDEELLYTLFPDDYAREQAANEW